VSWLTPLTGVILAAAVIPPLVLLYFLKLRRRPQAIASSLLWKKSIEDLRANAPFQKLRRSLLLFLQLVVLALLAMSVMQPRLHAGRHSGGRTILLIDNSASMDATDTEDGTRLAEARRRAREQVEAMYAGGLFSSSAGETMIVAFSDRAQVRCRFTDSKQQLLAAVDDIEVTHGHTSIADALKLARAYTITPAPDSDRPGGPPADIELFSDGRIGDLDDQVLRGETLRYYPIGTPEADNVGVGNISVERPFDRPTAVEVFAAILNFNQAPITCDMQLSVDGIVRGIQEVTVAPAEIDEATGILLPGRNNVVFTPFEQPRGAVIEVACVRPDDLMADNVAQVVVTPAKRLTVALVGRRRSPIRTALEGLTLESLQLFDLAAFEREAEAGRVDRFDVIVLDGVEPASLPPGRYLSFGPTPPVEGLHEFGKGEPQGVLTWKAEHPSLQYVTMDDVVVTRSHLLQPARDVETLVEGSKGPLVVAVSRGGLRVIHVAFDPLDSTWPLMRGFVTFVVNAVDHLGHLGEGLTSQGYAPGDALTARLPADASDIRLRTPDRTVVLEPIDPAQLSWGPARLAGLHVLSWRQRDREDEQEQAFAVNLATEREGNIMPRATIRIGTDQVSGELGAGDAYTPLWPWAVGLGLVVLMLEWWIYHRKAYI
jgi:hypothetical protein